MLNTRQSQILEAVIREYVGSVKPVSSGALARKYRMRVSPATIRNEFAVLTADGYLEKPHASAGRRPTNRGYRYYVNAHVLPHTPAADGEAQAATADPAELAETLAYCAGLLAAVWREDDTTIFRGLPQILSQPEFTSHPASMRLAALVDDLPRVLEKLFSLDAASGIFIGNECPFWEHNDVSILFRKIRFPSTACAVACIIGPTRMSYEKNWTLLAHSLGRK